MSDAPSPATAPGTGRCRELRLDVSPPTIEQDLDVWSALATGTRYRIVRLLQNHDEVCVCDIDASLDASQSAISHALSTLYSAGLVDRRKDGRWRYYRLTALARALLDAIDSTGGRSND